MKILNLDQIKEILPRLDPIKEIEEGFAAYSSGRAVVPPVGELIFHEPPGDVHIKYGYLKEDEFYVVKIASGFYNNDRFNLPSNSGLMLLFSQKTGETRAVLLDDGYLTDVRTAAAGAVAAKHLAPRKVDCIGVVGAGAQGRMQLEYLKPILSCRRALVWGVNEEELRLYVRDMQPQGFEIRPTRDVTEIESLCRLIITATPAKKPLLKAKNIRPGTHITAVGSDTPEKQELEPGILKKANLVVADSLAQCISRGEIHHALNSGHVRREEIVELGHIILGKSSGRLSEKDITVADLTGVAVQDIQIAKAVYGAIEGF
jgi:ornithine cyclodeaminase